MKILFFGDIIGKIGRRAIKEILPQLKAEFRPDLIIANGENLAHGLGVTERILNEMVAAGINVFTSGNHIMDKPEAEVLLLAKDSVLLKPANYPAVTSGQGFKIIDCAGKKIMVVSLVGRVFMKEEFECPFKKIDAILQEHAKRKLAGIIVDFHAEATSEKTAFGWYIDGRVSAVLGTHTHIPTADAKVLPNGTAYVSDVGMVGASNSVIGVEVEPIVSSFLNDTSARIEIPETGQVEVNAVLVEIDPKTGKAISIQRVDRKTNV